MTTTATAKRPRAAKKPRPKSDGKLSSGFRQNVSYEIAKLLEAGEKVTANDLVKRFNCSYPTVWQTLTRLFREKKIKRSFTEPPSGKGRGQFTFSL